MYPHEWRRRLSPASPLRLDIVLRGGGENMSIDFSKLHFEKFDHRLVELSRIEKLKAYAANKKWTPEKGPHNASSYTNHGCRCEVCTASLREKSKIYYHKNSKKLLAQSKARRDKRREIQSENA